MDGNQWIDLDKIMRVLYNNRKGISWYEIYTNLEMDKMYAKSLFEIAKADGYVKIANMGFNFDLPDPQIIRLTDAGLSFFARTNYENDHKNKFISTITVNNNISHSQDFNIAGDRNFNNNTPQNTDENKKSWSNPWIVSIGTAIIIAVLFFLIKKYYGIDLS